MSPFVAAISIASLIAIPSEPVESGVSSRIFFPASVVEVGEGRTSAPNVSMKIRRYGFCSYEAFTMNTRHSRSKKLHAIESDEPHWPAPVSVDRRRTPACLL